MRHHALILLLFTTALTAQTTVKNQVPPLSLEKKDVDSPAKELTPSEKRTLKQKKREEKRAKKKDVHTTIKTMTIKELGPAKTNYLKNDQKKFACSCLERMITLDRESQQDYRKELAELYMEIKEWANAERVLKDFVSLYPNSRDTEYAYFKTYECCWSETLNHDRDQEKTRECLEVADKYLAHEQYKEYRDKVNQIATNCYKKLLDHDMYVCRFYIKRKKNKSAKQRLKYMREKYLETTPCESDILVIECELAEKVGDYETLKEKSAELEKKYPQLKKQISIGMRDENGKAKRNYSQKF